MLIDHSDFRSASLQWAKVRLDGGESIKRADGRSFGRFFGPLLHDGV